MLNLKKLQTSTALALTVGMSSTAVAPIALMGSATAAPAPMTLAQLFPPSPSSTPPVYSGRTTIPAGTTLPMSYDQEKILVAPNETLKATLTLPVNVRGNDRDRTILIPSGSKVEGEFRPTGGGTQFFARTLIFPNGTRQEIDAISNVETRRETIRRGVSTDSLLKGAALGSGAAAIISGITGNKRITLGKVLIGTGAGALGGLLLGRNRNEVVVVNPQDLRVRLNSSLTLNPYRS